MAWQYYTDYCCPKCGTPVWYGRTTDNRVQFDIQDTICYGCETLEKDEADRERRKERKQPGVTKIAVPVGVSYDETGEFEPADWDTALDLVARRFAELKEEHGGESIAAFACSRSTNEDIYLFQKMARCAFDSPNVDNCARV